MIEEKWTDFQFAGALIGSEFRESYPVTCCSCGHEFGVSPSMLMKAFGMNSGAASCPSCRLYLGLRITDEGDRMESIDHVELLAAAIAKDGADG